MKVVTRGEGRLSKTERHSDTRARISLPRLYEAILPTDRRKYYRSGSRAHSELLGGGESDSIREPNKITALGCLAVVWLIHRMRDYLEEFVNYPFTVITDHQSLRWLQKLETFSGWLEC